MYKANIALIKAAILDWMENKMFSAGVTRWDTDAFEPITFRVKKYFDPELGCVVSMARNACCNRLEEAGLYMDDDPVTEHVRFVSNDPKDYFETEAYLDSWHWYVCPKCHEKYSEEEVMADNRYNHDYTHYNKIEAATDLNAPHGWDEMGEPIPVDEDHDPRIHVGYNTFKEEINNDEGDIVVNESNYIDGYDRTPCEEHTRLSKGVYRLLHGWLMFHRPDYAKRVIKKMWDALEYNKVSPQRMLELCDIFKDKGWSRIRGEFARSKEKINMKEVEKEVLRYMAFGAWNRPKPVTKKSIVKKSNISRRRYNRRIIWKWMNITGIYNTSKILKLLRKLDSMGPKKPHSKVFCIHTYPATASMREGIVIMASWDGKFHDHGSKYILGNDHIDKYVKEIKSSAIKAGYTIIEKNISVEVYRKYASRPLYKVVRNLIYAGKYWESVKSSEFACLL
jgi:hypothetical protein